MIGCARRTIRHLPTCAQKRMSHPHPLLRILYALSSILLLQPVTYQHLHGLSPWSPQGSLAAAGSARLDLGSLPTEPGQTSQAWRTGTDAGQKTAHTGNLGPCAWEGKAVHVQLDEPTVYCLLCGTPLGPKGSASLSAACRPTPIVGGPLQARENKQFKHQVKLGL